jgi:hypothetical protein
MARGSFLSQKFFPKTAAGLVDSRRAITQQSSRCLAALWQNVGLDHSKTLKLATNWVVREKKKKKLTTSHISEPVKAQPELVP